MDMKRYFIIYMIFLMFLLQGCKNTSTDTLNLYYDNMVTVFEYEGQNIEDVHLEEDMMIDGSISFGGVIFKSKACGKFNIKEIKNENIIESIEIIIDKDDLSESECQENLFLNYGKNVANGTEKKENEEYYWERYFTGTKIVMICIDDTKDHYSLIIE